MNDFLGLGDNAVVLYEQMESELKAIQSQVQKVQEHLNNINSKYAANDFWKNSFDHIARTIAEVRIQGEKVAHYEDHIQRHNVYHPFQISYENGQLTVIWENIEGSKVFQPTQLVHYQHYHQYFKALGSYQSSLRDYVRECFERGFYFSAKTQPEIRQVRFRKPKILYELTFPDKHERDFDNFVMKHITDSLVRHRFITDDNMDSLEFEYKYLYKKGKNSIEATLFNRD